MNYLQLKNKRFQISKEDYKYKIKLNTRVIIIIIILNLLNNVAFLQYTSTSNEQKKNQIPLARKIDCIIVECLSNIEVKRVGNNCHEAA